MKNKTRFIELYIQLMKCRKDGYNNSHIYISKFASVYCDGNTICYYVTHNKPPKDSYISFSIDGIILNIGEYKPLKNTKILNLMEECLKDWSNDEK